ncbi:MAG: purN [Myxococcaceae bacterium]|nr:purN [Myxococcaceae bacterium]
MTTAGARDLRVGVLASGSGSNLQALIDAGVQIVVLVCNVPGAKCLDRAKAAGIEAVVLDHHAFASREAYDLALLAELKKRQVQLVCLAGFMRLLTAKFLAEFTHAVINVHPSLLPAFPGIHSARQALAYGVKLTGCTVHFVDEGTDTGPIIAQAAVPVFDGDDEARLQARIQVEEHRLFPAVVAAYVQGRVTVQGRKVTTR